MNIVMRWKGIHARLRVDGKEAVTVEVKQRRLN